MMIRSIGLGLLAGLFCMNAARAQQTDMPHRVDVVVQGWMSKYQIASAEVAVADKGKLVASFGHGWQPSDKQPVASLSKAITGLCVSKLLDQGKLKPQDTLGQVLGAALKAPKDPRFASITIEQLLTHRSGIIKNAVDDAKDHTIEDGFASTAQAQLESDPGTAIDYSDSAYLVLGYVIQHITGQHYADACSKVFTDAGLPRNAGIIDPTLAARAPNGGWAIDAEDYAKMLRAIAHLGATSQAWLAAQRDDPAYLTHGPCGRFHAGQSYGFGFCQRHDAKGIVYYHDGLMHLHPPYYKKSGGSFFFVNEQGQAAVVIFSGENGGDVYKALENGVISAMRAP